MTIYLVRHGETAFNRDGQTLGQADLPLTDVGIAQAHAVAERLASANVTRVISSPLRRALTMACLVAERHGMEATPLAALKELDVGETEGLEFAELRRRYPEFLRIWASDEGWTARMPGGESIQDLGLRLEPLAGELLAHESSDIVVVSHNFTLRVLLCQLLGLPLSRFRSFEIGLAAVTSVAVRDGRAGVRSVNDTCHLSNLNLA